MQEKRMLDPEQTKMFAEAREAADCVRRLLAESREPLAAIGEHLRRRPPRAVLTCARGSSDHAATFAKYLIETRLGIPTASMAPSVASAYGASLHVEEMLCLAVSQSGRSPDLISTVRAAKQGGATILALVNDPASPLANEADLVLPLHAGPELSVAATKSFIASLVAIVAIVAAWADDNLLKCELDGVAEYLDAAWDLDWQPLVEHLAGGRGLFVIGRGMGLGVAQEAALKFKETSGIHAEAFSAAEVRHGPMALIGANFPLLVFQQPDGTEASVDSLVGEATARGSTVLVAGAAPAGATSLPTVATASILAPILQIQSFYRAINVLALARGYDPDNPPYLQKVTRTV